MLNIKEHNIRNLLFKNDVCLEAPVAFEAFVPEDAFVDVVTSERADVVSVRDVISPAAVTSVLSLGKGVTSSSSDLSLSGGVL